MLFNSGVGKDSWESLGLQGDPTSFVFWSLLLFNYVNKQEIAISLKEMSSFPTLSFVCCD